MGWRRVSGCLLWKWLEERGRCRNIVDVVRKSGFFSGKSAPVEEDERVEAKL